MANGNHVYPKSFSGSGKAAPPAPFLAGASQQSGVTGEWEGVSQADCLVETEIDPSRCNAEQKITLTMVQQGVSVSGYYHCDYGTQVCRNLDESGVIRDGHMTGRRLSMRVMLEDGSMCFFTGMPQNNVIEGRYSCLQGGGIVERGAFRTVRAY
jgi:hypothetical protein